MSPIPTAPPGQSCPDLEKWSAFSLGQLPPEALQPLAEHLELCPSCCATVQGLQGQTDELVEHLRRPPAEDPYASEPACRQALTRLRDVMPSSTPPAGANDTAVVRQFGPYQLQRRVGAGSMGNVFQAVHQDDNRVVALKILSGKRAGEPLTAARFRREIEAVRRLDHPHIVRATDAGEIEGVLYLAMEYVAGIDLARLLRARDVLPVPDGCEVVRQAALGLHQAHQHGIVHRDVKPSNLLLSTDGQVKVLDLGLILTPADLAGEEALTSSGQVLGTLDYMAPEQGRDTRAVDARADVYSLGCTLYHLLTGHAPFAGPRHQTPQSKLWAHAYEPLPPLGGERPEVSPALVALVERMLAKNPADRFATAAEVAAALAPFADGANPSALLAGIELEPAAPPPPLPRRKRTAFLVALSSVAALLLAGIVWSAVDRFTGPPADNSLNGGGGSEDAQPDPDEAEQKGPPVYPAALFTFEERGTGARELGPKVTDLLFAKLAAKEGLTLVDREDLRKTLAEAELNLSGAIKPGEATQVGQLTGARLLLTGSVVPVDRKVHLVAKVIGTETGRVRGVSVAGKADDLETLVGQLADQVAELVGKHAGELAAQKVARKDRLAALKEQLKKGTKPAVLLSLSERHVGAAAFDPAAQTELSLYCKETGFTVIDAEEGRKTQADVLINGEGLSTFTARHGNLVTVKARLEVKAVERATGKVLAVDRQTTVVVDLTEQLAGKAALQEAAAAIAQRLLPKLVKQ